MPWRWVRVLLKLLVNFDVHLGIDLDHVACGLDDRSDPGESFERAGFNLDAGPGGAQILISIVTTTGIDVAQDGVGQGRTRSPLRRESHDVGDVIHVARHLTDRGNATARAKRPPTNNGAINAAIIHQDVVRDS